MVFYFSGTGNSQFAANQIAQALADDVVLINHYLKKGEKVSFNSDRPLVFVAPTYSWRMPKIVERWITDTDFTGCRDAYVILTCGGSCGNAAAYAEKLFSQKGLNFCGLAPLPMPDNYLVLFPTPDESECRAIVEQSKPRLAALAERIRSGERFPGLPVSFGDRVRSGPINPLFYTFFVRDAGFTVSNQCVSCGKCAERCPLNNVELVHGKPVWKGNCTHCMACIAGCPAAAIEYKSKSKGRHRHFIMKD